MLKRVLAKVSEYLYYNRRERNGVLVLLCCLFFVYAATYFYFLEQENIEGASAFFAKIDSLKSLEKKISKRKIAYFNFNPNTATQEQLMLLGFSKKQTKNLLNYRKAGGKFYKKEDFKKLYFVTDSIYPIYKEYIKIPAKKKAQKIREKAKSKKKVPLQLFDFNPNTIAKKQWLALGISERTTRTILNYLKKGGHFYKKEDIKKIYGFSKEDYSRLEHYVVIPKIKKIAEKKQLIKILDLNTITLEELRGLKIQEKIAKRILKFRKLLGGFARKSQLKEVYGIHSYQLKILEKYTEVQTDVKKINVNTATEKELSGHLYLSFSDARAIVRYRERKGKYHDIKTLKAAKILTDKVFEKIQFYLEL